MGPLRNIDKYQIIDKRECLSIKCFEYFADVRGFLYFETFWQPKENELLSCHFENGNFFDICATKPCEEKREMTGSPLVKDQRFLVRCLFLVKDQRFLVRCLFLCLGHELTFCFREVLPLNQRFVLGTERKSDLGLFRCPNTCFTIT